MTRYRARMMTDEQLWHYEHAYLRPLHPDATDAQIAAMVEAFRADLARYAADRAGRMEDAR